MESFFAVLASASLIFTWASGAKLHALYAAQDACAGGVQYQLSAAQNVATLETAAVAPFGRIETGWKLYAPQVTHTIGSPCTPDTRAFAATLATWQAEHRLPATGAMNTVTLSAMKGTWQQARPFVAAFAAGSCPPAPAEEGLAAIAPREGWRGKISKLDADALSELRRMVTAAHAEDPRIAADPLMLTIVSAFRSPAYDAERCKNEGNCNGIARARCSAHRTGRAVDFYIGALPGHSPVASDDANRLYQTQRPAYQWLVKNAARFGFVNYVFEPWHWEWVGRSAPQTQMVAAYEAKDASTGTPATSPSVTHPKSAIVNLTARLQGLFGQMN